MDFTKERKQAYAELLAAEAHYLRLFGWAPLVPAAPGAPIFWRDQRTGEERSQDVAVVTEKLFTNDLLKGK